MKYLIIPIILVLGVCAWCPWFKPADAQKVLDDKVIEVKKKYADLCELAIKKETLHKVVFGYREEVLYDCVATDQVYGVTKSDSFVLITFYKSVLAMPVEVVER